MKQLKLIKKTQIAETLRNINIGDEGFVTYGDMPLRSTSSTIFRMQKHEGYEFKVTEFPEQNGYVIRRNR